MEDLRVPRVLTPLEAAIVTRIQEIDHAVAILQDVVVGLKRNFREMMDTYVEPEEPADCDSDESVEILPPRRREGIAFIDLTAEEEDLPDDPEDDHWRITCNWCDEEFVEDDVIVVEELGAFCCRGCNSARLAEAERPDECEPTVMFSDMMCCPVCDATGLSNADMTKCELCGEEMCGNCMFMHSRVLAVCCKYDVVM